MSQLAHNETVVAKYDSHREAADRSFACAIAFPYYGYRSAWLFNQWCVIQRDPSKK